VSRRNGFPCPHCGSHESVILQTREEPRKGPVDLRAFWPDHGNWRERKCTHCGHLFHTREYVWPPKKPLSSASPSSTPQ
jgi:transcriptional regulator NrdR family protein